MDELTHHFRVLLLSIFFSFIVSGSFYYFLRGINFNNAERFLQVIIITKLREDKDKERKGAEWKQWSGY